MAHCLNKTTATIATATVSTTGCQLNSNTPRVNNLTVDNVI
jgi:hypothetical protein